MLLAQDYLVGCFMLCNLVVALLLLCAHWKPILFAGALGASTARDDANLNGVVQDDNIFDGVDRDGVETKPPNAVVYVYEPPTKTSLLVNVPLKDTSALTAVDAAAAKVAAPDRFINPIGDNESSGEDDATFPELVPVE